MRKGNTASCFFSLHPSALPADDAADAWLGTTMLFDRLGVTVLSATVNDRHGSYTKLTFNHRGKI